MATPTYSKLTGKRRSWIQYSQLWVAADHLLMIQSSRFTEEYSRYRFEDIEAIVITELESEPLRQIVFALIALSAFVLSWVVPDSRFLKIFFAMPSGALLAAVALDVLRGPKCRCLLRTAVSEHILRPVTRVRTANRVVTELHRLITEVQGSLENISGETVVSQGLSPEPVSIAKPSKFILYVLLASLVVNLILSLALLRWDSVQLNTIALYALFGEIVFAVLVYRQRPRFGINSTFYSTWMPIILVFLGVEVLLTAAYFGYYLTLIADAQKAKTLLESPRNWPYFKESTMFSAAWRLPAAILTLIHVRSTLPEED